MVVRNTRTGKTAHTQKKFRVRTIKETIYECHIDTKKLDYRFAYEQLEGANEGFQAAHENPG